MWLVDGWVMAGTHGAGVFASADHGDSWSSASQGLPAEAHIRSLAGDGSLLVAGTDAGDVFMSVLPAFQWMDVSNGLPAHPVLSLWPSGDHLYAGLSGEGVWKHPLWQTTDVGAGLGTDAGADDDTPDRSAPTPLALAQNHPNPFNPGTTITFVLATPGHLELTVFDAHGRSVRQLLDEVRATGEHRVLWDGRDDRGNAVPSGRYFYRLRAGAIQDARGMLLLR